MPIIIPDDVGPYPDGRKKERVAKAISSGKRLYTRSSKKANTSGSVPKHSPGQTASCESDSAADTCCSGANHRMIELTGEVCNVNGFKDEMTVRDVPVATTATAYTVPGTSDTYILIFNESLYFGEDMDHSLMNPNQIRASGIPVSDNPFDEDRDFGIHHEDLFIPFRTKGTRVYIETHCPTDEELAICPKIEMTSSNTWDPESVNLGHEDKAHGDYRLPQDVAMIQSMKRKRSHDENYGIRSEADVVLGTISDMFTPDIFLERMIASVKIDSKKPKEIRISNVGTFNSNRERSKARKGKASISKVRANTRHSIVTPEHVARTFRIGLDKAIGTLEVTTQKGIRTANFPITRRYRVKNSLHRQYVSGKWCVDWMSSKTRSIDGCSGAFVYSDGIFPIVYPKETKNQVDAKDSLQSFCQDVGTPAMLKSDLEPEFSGRRSDFGALIRREGITMSHKEKGRENQVWQVDQSIRELKKRWHTLMIEKGVPKRLWSFGIKYCAEIMQRIPSRRLGNRTPFI